MTDAERIQAPTTIRLTKDQREAVRRLARREKRSVGNTIRVLLSEALDARTGKREAA